VSAVNPVTLLPGRASEATMPWVTASAEPAMTMGIVDVTPFTAKAVMPLAVTITSTFAATSSAASLGRSP
jgi:hypothetical protein